MALPPGLSLHVSTLSETEADFLLRTGGIIDSCNQQFPKGLNRLLKRTVTVRFQSLEMKANLLTENG